MFVVGRVRCQKYLSIGPSLPLFLHSSFSLCTPMLASSFPHSCLPPESLTLLVICSVRVIVIPMICTISGVSLIVVLLLASQLARLSCAPFLPGQSLVPESKSMTWSTRLPSTVRWQLVVGCWLLGVLVLAAKICCHLFDYLLLAAVCR